MTEEEPVVGLFSCRDLEAVPEVLNFNGADSLKDLITALSDEVNVTVLSPCKSIVRLSSPLTMLPSDTDKSFKDKVLPNSVAVKADVLLPKTSPPLAAVT